MKALKNRLRAFWKRNDGSDTTEMIATTAIIIVFVMIGIMLLSYVMEYTIFNSAVQRVARTIETTGMSSGANANSQLRGYLSSNSNLKNITATVSDEGKIQLTDTFSVKASCTYDIPLINPGNFTGYTLHLPIEVTVTGMSEVYWRN